MKTKREVLTCKLTGQCNIKTRNHQRYIEKGWNQNGLKNRFGVHFVSPLVKR